MRIESTWITEVAGRMTRHLGFSFDGRARTDLRSAVGARMDATGCPDEAHYLCLLDSREELELLAEEITVGETYFFRDPNQFSALGEAVLPPLVSQRRSLRILSAGCSTGEEPHSLAILLAGLGYERGDHPPILGIDVNRNALEVARSGTYGSWAFRRTPPGHIVRSFTPRGDRFALCPDIARMVAFERRNLLDDDDGFWAEGSFDLILCRNVIMYFTQEIATAVVERMSRALRPGGHMFLGSSDLCSEMPSGLTRVHSHETCYFRAEAAAPAAPQGPPRPSPSLKTPERPGDTSNRAAASLGAARAALERECFALAIELLDALPDRPEDSVQRHLLRGVALLNRGQIHAAEDALLAAIADDEFNGAAYYHLGICCEQMDEIDLAVDNYRRAAYLDPHLAMPHLQLGRLARFRGDDRVARRELEHALRLLRDDRRDQADAWPGAFSRSTIESLCSAELETLGGTVRT